MRCSQHRNYFVFFQRNLPNLFADGTQSFKTFATLLSHLAITNHSHLHELDLHWDD